MKFTVITDSTGEIIATQREYTSKDNLQARLIAGPEQTLHEIEAPDEFGNITEPRELHARMKSHMQKKS